MSRYNDILRGPELADAYQKYQTWLTQSRAAKQADYATVAKPLAQRVRPVTESVRILPFSTVANTTALVTKAPALAGQTAQNEIAQVCRGLADDLLTLSSVTIPTGTTVLKVKGFKFARVIATKRTAEASVVAESRITKIPYRRWRTNNASCPFGRDETRTSFAQAVNYMRGLGLFSTASDEAGERIGFMPERSSLN